MSLCRAFKRRAYQRSGKEWPSLEQPTKYIKGVGYWTLRPTKGWLFVSEKRTRAQARIRATIETIERRKAMGR